MRLMVLALIPVLCIGACSLEAPTAAPDGPLARNINLQSHDIHWDLNATFVMGAPTCTGATLTNAVTSEGTNTLSHLGNATGYGEACVWRAPSGYAGRVESTGMELQSANGDKIHFDISGTFAIDPSALPTITFIHTGTYQITGGTGRFANAGGEGVYTATNTYLTSNTGVLNFEFDGTLIY